MIKKNRGLEEDPQKTLSMFAKYYEDLLTIRKAESLKEIEAEGQGRQILAKKETPEAITLKHLM